MAIVAGFAGGAVLLGWVWPRVAIDGSFFLATPPSAVRASLSDKTARELADRILPVYRRVENVGTQVNALLNKDKIGDAVVVSSDGWLAVAGNKAVLNLNAVVLAPGGKMLPIEKIVDDKETGVVYLKIAAPDQAGEQSGQFKIVSFADGVTPGDEVFVFNQGWWQLAAATEKRGTVLDSPHLDSVPVAAVSLDVSAPQGSLVMMPDGRLAGFVGNNSELIPAAAVAHVVPGVLSGGVVDYPTLGVEGWFSDELPVVVNGVSQTGFLVNKVRDKNSVLRRGDLITQVNGYTPKLNNWWGALQGSTSLKLTVWRAGKSIQLTAQVLSTDK